MNTKHEISIILNNAVVPWVIFFYSFMVRWTGVQLHKGQNTPKYVGLQSEGSSKVYYLGFDYLG